MKRSEMVDRLKKFGVDNQIFDLRDQYDYIIASQILDFLEEEGMLPPTVNYDTRAESFFDQNIWEEE